VPVPFTSAVIIPLLPLQRHCCVTPWSGRPRLLGGTVGNWAAPAWIVWCRPPCSGPR
jgi:hypothetical protein